MILVSQEARQAAEQARLQSEGLVPAVAEKRRKRKDRMPGSDAHAAAEGALGHVTDEGDEDCVPVSELPGVGKGYEVRGIHEGPGDPVMPGQISPADFSRPYIQDGHGAPSPGYAPPNHPHVDLRGDRGMIRDLGPFPPSMPVDGPGDAA